MKNTKEVKIPKGKKIFIVRHMNGNVVGVWGQKIKPFYISLDLTNTLIEDSHSLKKYYQQICDELRKFPSQKIKIPATPSEKQIQVTIEQCLYDEDYSYINPAIEKQYHDRKNKGNKNR